MRLRLAAALLAPVAALAFTAPPASADDCYDLGYGDDYSCHEEFYDEDTPPMVHSVTVTPNPAVTNATGGTKVTVIAKVSDDVSLDDVDVELESAALDDWEWPTMSYVSTNATGVETWTGSVYVDKYNSTGKWYTHVDAWDTDYNRTEHEYFSSFHVKKNVALTVNASPEPVTYNGTVKVAGNLKRLTDYDGYVNYGGKTIQYYFKPVGGTYSYMGSSTTNSYGNYSKSFSYVKKDGTWRAEFPGTSNYVKKGSSDYVDVS